MSRRASPGETRDPCPLCGSAPKGDEYWSRPKDKPCRDCQKDWDDFKASRKEIRKYLGEAKDKLVVVPNYAGAMEPDVPYSIHHGYHEMRGYKALLGAALQMIAAGYPPAAIQTLPEGKWPRLFVALPDERGNNQGGNDSTLRVIPEDARKAITMVQILFSEMAHTSYAAGLKRGQDILRQLADGKSPLGQEEETHERYLENLARRLDQGGWSEQWLHAKEIVRQQQAALEEGPPRREDLPDGTAVINIHDPTKSVFYVRGDCRCGEECGKVRIARSMDAPDKNNDMSAFPAHLRIVREHAK